MKFKVDLTIEVGLKISIKKEIKRINYWKAKEDGKKYTIFLAIKHSRLLNVFFIFALSDF